MNRMEFLRRCALRKSWGGGRLFYVGALVAFFGTVLGTCHGLVIPTITDLPAIPFQYSLNGEGEYVVKMRLEAARLHALAGYRNTSPNGQKRCIT